MTRDTFTPSVWLACDTSGWRKQETVWLYHILLLRSHDLLDDLDNAAIHLIHMDTLTSPTMPYLSEDQVIYLGLD